MPLNKFPTIATGKVFQTYLDAARQNLDNLVRLAAALKDGEFGREAQIILDSFDDSAMDAFALINEANENASAFADLTPREIAGLSVYRGSDLENAA